MLEQYLRHIDSLIPFLFFFFRNFGVSNDWTL